MRLCFFLLLVGILPTSFRVLAAPQVVEKVSVDFLYVNANTGGGAGGHTALRLGNTIYHYQFFSDSTFLLVRDHWTSFYFLYNELHNRTIYVASVPISKASFMAIKRHFTELLIDQQQRFSSLQGLRAQVEISRAIVNGKGSVSIAGLGFFSKTTDNQLNSTTRLRYKIEKKLGPKGLQETLETDTKQTLLETLSWQESLRVLQNNFSLDPTAVIAPIPGEPVLVSSELLILKRFHHKQLQSILALLQSSRPDKGEALLLQTARYLVVEKSLQAKQFYTLDPFPDDVKTVKLSAEEKAQSRSQVQTRLLQQSRQRMTLFFREKTHQEVAYSLLETSRARVSELRLAGSRQHEVRLLPKVQLPSRSRRITLKPTTGRMVSQTSLEEMEEGLGILEKEVANRYNYNLVFKNCATELVRSLNTTFTSREDGTRRLGGWLEADSNLVFVPFLLYDRSVTAFPVQDEQILTSRRLRHLERLYARENDLLVWLRESNTLSSTLYKPRSKDTYFLFFTDDSLLLRPLQGVLNLGYASLHGVAGVFTLPFDGGERIQQAGRGIFYSLPEIVFCNIRKGSYATGESRPTPPGSTVKLAKEKNSSPLLGDLRATVAPR